MGRRAGQRGREGGWDGSVLLTLLKSIIGSFTEHHLIVIGLLIGPGGVSIFK